MTKGKSGARSGVLYDKPGRIEHYEKRFGLAAIRKGFITAEDLVCALAVQIEEDLGRKPHRLMGEILFSLGVMTDRQVEEVLGELFKNRISRADGDRSEPGAKPSMG